MMHKGNDFFGATKKKKSISDKKNGVSTIFGKSYNKIEDEKGHKYKVSTIMAN